MENQTQEPLDEQQGQIQQRVQEQSRRIMEEIEVEGRQVVERVKELMKEGNVRKLIIKDPDGKYSLEIPLTIGVAVGSVFAIAAPLLAALGAMAALMSRVKIEIQREI